MGFVFKLSLLSVKIPNIQAQLREEGLGAVVSREAQPNACVSAGKSDQMREVVLVAVGEAAVKLLILGLCLVFLM